MLAYASTEVSIILLFVGTIAITMLLSYLTYIFIEKPGINLGRKITNYHSKKREVKHLKEIT